MNDFGRQVADLVPRLRAFARSLTAGDRHLADDLVHDTIVSALQAQGQFTPGTNLAAWLFTILRNRFRTLMAGKRVRAEVELEESVERTMWAPAGQEASVEVQAFRRAFGKLSPHHREALVLTAVEGLTHERVAEICSCEVGTVKSRVSRARGLLKRMLLDERPLAAPPPRGRPPAERQPQPKLPGSACSNRERVRP
jgi:RNA polymerase sigma-70 factor (ECF subfamily)